MGGPPTAGLEQLDVPTLVIHGRQDPLVTLSGDWEQAFAESLVGLGEEKQLAMAPSKLQEFIRGVREAFERAALAGADVA